jgi:hypothetical protein
MLVGRYERHGTEWMVAFHGLNHYSARREIQGGGGELAMSYVL